MVLANGLFELFDDGENGYAVCDLYLSIDSYGMDALSGDCLDPYAPCFSNAVLEYSRFMDGLAER
jgi:hypothetical protein